MAFTGITATEAEIDQKAGTNAPSAYTDTMKTQALLQAESFVNVLTGFNWSDWYAGTPNVDVKYIVTEVTASIVAIEFIKYDMWGYTTIEEAENMVNILWARVEQIIKVLKEIGTQKFMRDA